MAFDLLTRNEDEVLVDFHIRKKSETKLSTSIKINFLPKRKTVWFVLLLMKLYLTNKLLLSYNTEHVSIEFRKDQLNSGETCECS